MCFSLVVGVDTGFAYPHYMGGTSTQFFGSGSGSIEVKSSSYVPYVTITNTPNSVIYTYSSEPIEDYLNNAPYQFGSGSDDSYLIHSSGQDLQQDDSALPTAPDPVLTSNEKPIPEPATLTIPAPQQYQSVTVPEQGASVVAQPVTIENYSPK